MIPVGRENAAEVEVLAERELAVPGGGGGWVFDVAVRVPGCGESRHEVRLSWVDYEHWSHGAAAPERVARSAVEVAMEHGSDERLPSGLPARFDASTVRRWVEQADDRIREKLGGGGIG